MNGKIGPLFNVDKRTLHGSPMSVRQMYYYLSEESGYDRILTITDRLGLDVQIIPCMTKPSAEQLAVLFFDRWYCENGLPLEIISDYDKLFIAKLWKHLMLLLTDIKHCQSSAYHPQMDGASEKSNKTITQLIRFHVEPNQTGWLRTLPWVRFSIIQHEHL